MVLRSAPASPGWAYDGQHGVVVDADGPGSAGHLRQRPGPWPATLCAVPAGNRRVGESGAMATDQRPPGPDVSVRRAVAGAYVESLRVPLRWWALATMFLASMLLAFLVALPAVVAYAATGVIGGADRARFWSLRQRPGRGGRRGAARRPGPHPGEPPGRPRGPGRREDTRRVAGVDADARAYLLLRPYIRPACGCGSADPADPTPYWLVSTRHPRTLAAALRGRRPGLAFPAGGHRAD